MVTSRSTNRGGVGGQQANKSSVPPVALLHIVASPISTTHRTSWVERSSQCLVRPPLCLSLARECVETDGFSAGQGMFTFIDIREEVVIGILTTANSW